MARYIYFPRIYLILCLSPYFKLTQYLYTRILKIEHFLCCLTENQEKIQEEKQNKAQEKRDEARVLKEIEKAQKEMNRLDKYVNLQENT